MAGYLFEWDALQDVATHGYEFDIRPERRTPAPQLDND